MLRALTLTAITLGMSGCMGGGWAAWDNASKHTLASGEIDAPQHVVENRVRWRGTEDLSGEFLMALGGENILSVVGYISDDFALRQGRRGSSHAGWWLQRIGGDGVGVVVSQGDEEFEVIAAFGSAGINPEVVQGMGGDAVHVWPTPNGVRFEVLADLGARGLEYSHQTTEVSVRVYDEDAQGDWSVHEVTLR